MTKNLIMTDCLEIKGKWFLPNNDRNKNNQVPGTLCYSPQQIELRLVGVFEDGLSLPQCDDPSKSIIHGISDDDKCFTLVDCISSHVNHIYFICKDPDCLLQSGPCFLIYTPDSNQPLQPVITPPPAAPTRPARRHPPASLWFMSDEWKQ